MRIEHMDSMFFLFLAALGFLILIIGAIKRPAKDDDKSWLWIIPFMGN
jgi:hypothetical protein